MWMPRGCLCPSSRDNLEDRFAREAGKFSECPSKSKAWKGHATIHHVYEASYGT